MTAPITTNRSELFCSLGEEQLMKEIESLEKDDYFTIHMFIIPNLKKHDNIAYAESIARQRYHTYGDCR